MTLQACSSFDYFFFFLFTKKIWYKTNKVIKECWLTWEISEYKQAVHFSHFSLYAGTGPWVARILCINRLRWSWLKKLQLYIHLFFNFGNNDGQVSAQRHLTIDPNCWVPIWHVHWQWGEKYKPQFNVFSYHLCLRKKLEQLLSTLSH